MARKVSAGEKAKKLRKKESLAIESLENNLLMTIINVK